MQTIISSNLRVSPELPPLAAPVPADSIAPHVCAGAIKVPPWFTVGAALRVAACKGVEHLLVVDRGAVAGTVSVQALRAAPAADPLARWMTASTVTLAPETSRTEAVGLMARMGVDCLPVASGLLLVGLVTREELAFEQRPAG